MPNLQAALDEFKSEVALLEKTKTGLIQDNIGLESKKTFLTGAVRDLEIAKNLAKKKYDKTINALVEDLEAVETAIDERKIDLKLALDKIDNAKSELKIQEDKNSAKIIESARQLQLKKGEITATESLKKKALEELVATTKQVKVEQAKLGDVAGKLKTTKDEAESEITQISQRVVEAHNQLKKIKDKIDKKALQYTDLEEATALMQIKLTDMTKQHNDFLEYEKRAKKALEARESALLQGERNLAVAKRRNPSSVLDKVS